MPNTEKLPVSDPSFWKKRVDTALQSQQIHRAVYDIPLARWNALNAKTKKTLATPLSRPNLKILDAGCGYGCLIPLLPEVPHVYTGVDLSPDLIALARQRHPYHEFHVQDLRSLPYPDKHFDVAICRSVEGMIKDNLGFEEWHAIEAELKRVAQTTILLSYGEPSKYTLLEDYPEEPTIGRIHCDHGKLVYLSEPGRICQIYDIEVENGHRHQGIGTKLLTSLMELNYFYSLYAITRLENTAARRFYTSLGFQQSQLKNLYPRQDATICYRTNPNFRI